MEDITHANFSNIEAEKSLLGFLIINNNFFEEIVDTISADVFFLEIHQNVFTLIVDLLNQSKLADIVTISNLASYTPDYQEITFDYLLELTNSIVSTGSYKEYTALIYDLYVKRQIISLQSNISNYLNSADNYQEQISKIETDLFELAEKGSITKSKIKFEDHLYAAIQSADIARQHKNGISGVTTGLRELDKKFGGLQKSDLIVLAGRPSMGKTALATNIAFNSAEKFLEDGFPGAPTAIFSLEMSGEQIASRILSEAADISSDQIRKGTMNDAEFVRLTQGAEKLKNTPIYIDDTPNLSLSSLRTRCRRFKRQHDIGLIVIDYIQLLQANGRHDSRANEVSAITRALKGIAKEINVPIIALSQLNRTVEFRDDKTPMLSDLRESGSIEQDADIVSFIFREEYYLSRDEPKVPKKDETEESFKKRYTEWLNRLAEVKNKATVIIAKNRHGAIGNIDLQFVSEKTKFYDIDKNH